MTNEEWAKLIPGDQIIAISDSFYKGSIWEIVDRKHTTMLSYKPVNEFAKEIFKEVGEGTFSNYSLWTIYITKPIGKSKSRFELISND